MAPKKKVIGLDQAPDPGRGRANPAPPVGPALGQHGVNIMEFCKAYNAATESQRGNVIPVEITRLRGPLLHVRHRRRRPPPSCCSKAAGVQEGVPATPHTTKVAIAPGTRSARSPSTKKEDLNANDIDAAAKIIAGTARSMGITVK